VVGVSAYRASISASQSGATRSWSRDRPYGHNLNSDDGSSCRELPGCIPHRFRRTTIVGDPPVCPRAQGIRDEVIAGSAIVGSVEDHHDRIVAEQVGIALRELCRDCLAVPGSKRHVQVAGIVEDQCLGAASRLFAASRLVLDEVGHRDGALPFVVSDSAVDDRRLRRFDGLNLRQR